MLIDAHAHIFRRVRGRIGSGATRSLPYGRVRVGGQAAPLIPALNRAAAFPPEALLENMARAGVDRAVLLQGPYYGDVNEYVAAAVRKWPDRFAGAGLLDPCAPDARAAFAHIAGDLGLRILKLEFSEEAGLCGIYPHLRVGSPALAWLWEACERQGVVVTLDLGTVASRSYDTPAVAEILQRHPRLKVVVAHLAQPPFDKRDDEALNRLWQEQILLAGRFPNVWFDLSALPAFCAPEEYPYPTVQHYIRRAVELVGAEKVMWGSDAPGLLCYATYQQLLDLVKKHCEFLSPTDRDRVLGSNARHVYWEQSQEEYP